MAHNDIRKYSAAYAKLLRMYPKSYRQRFAEPMQQMFVDMCNERRSQSQDARGWVYKIYAETLVSVITEHIQEGIMHIKTTKARVIMGITLIAVGSIVAVILANNHTDAQVIHPGSMLKQVRELSKGKKNACLPHVQSAADAVHRDDVITEYKGNKFSNFEIAASEAIADIPAGTDYDVTINSYMNGTAVGTMTYEKNYGQYNYIITKQPSHGEWKLINVVACKKP